MEKLEKIILNKGELNGLPLYFHKIYFNRIVNSQDEEKCYYYSRHVQSIIVKETDPLSDIAKLINFNEYEKYSNK